jgi:hypothetical protein
MFDTADGANPVFLKRGKKRCSVLTPSIPRASGRGAEWVEGFLHLVRTGFAGHCEAACPYGVPIQAKLLMAHENLTP